MQQVMFSIQAIKSNQSVMEDTETAEIEYENGDSYSGPIVQGARSGEGTYTFQNGDIYVGTFVNGLFNGKGIYTTESGDMYEGNFVEGQILGQGLATYANIPGINTYEGFWADGMASGRGKLTFDLGDNYEGQFERGRFHGKGVMSYTNGDVYDGTYVEGKPQGEGQFMFKEASLIQRRKFADGVDRANTCEIKFNTYSIKKKENVHVKQFKQSEGKKLFHPKAAKIVNNSSIVSGLLGDSVRKNKKQLTEKAKKILKIKAFKAKKSSLANMRATSLSAVPRSKPRKPPTKHEWPEYDFTYPNAVQAMPVDSQQIFKELDQDGQVLKRTKSMKTTIEAARRYFAMIDRIRALKSSSSASKTEQPSATSTN